MKKIDRSMFIASRDGHHPRISATAPGDFKLDGASFKQSGTPHQFQRLNLSKLNSSTVDNTNNKINTGSVTKRKTLDKDHAFFQQVRIVSKFK